MASVRMPAPPAADTHVVELVEEVPQLQVPAAVTRELAHVPTSADERCQAQCQADAAIANGQTRKEWLETLRYSWSRRGADRRELTASLGFYEWLENIGGSPVRPKAVHLDVVADVKRCQTNAARLPHTVHSAPLGDRSDRGNEFMTRKLDMYLPDHIKPKRD